MRGLRQREHVDGCTAPFTGKDCDCPPEVVYVAVDDLTKPEAVAVIAPLIEEMEGRVPEHVIAGAVLAHLRTWLKRATCEHNFVDVWKFTRRIDEAVASGEMCTRCGTVRPGEEFIDIEGRL